MNNIEKFMIFELNQYKSLIDDNDDKDLSINAQCKEQKQKQIIPIKKRKEGRDGREEKGKEKKEEKDNNLDKLFLKFYELHTSTITKTTSFFFDKEIKNKLEETKIKIDYFETLKKMSGLKELLKKLKLKITDIETNFINENNINVKTLVLLIISFLLPRVFILHYKKCVYIYISSSLTLLYDNIVLDIGGEEASYGNNNENYSVKTNIPTEELEKYTRTDNDNYYLVDDIHFKLKSITSYKLSELVDIHKKLFKNNSKEPQETQKRTKQDIYNQISTHIIL